MSVVIAGENSLMSGYDFDSPFISQDAMQAYIATNRVGA